MMFLLYHLNFLKFLDDGSIVDVYGNVVTTAEVIVCYRTDPGLTWLSCKKHCTGLSR